MHKEVLTVSQIKLLPLVKEFSRDFGLVGGTAIALHLGHRRSIDFDLFTNKEFDNLRVRGKIAKYIKIDQVITDESDQFTVVVKGVRLTFLNYPFKINFVKNFDNAIKLPDLLTLAAMKAYALGRRPKWKDYVDLYFIIKEYRGLGKIIAKAKKIYSQEFSEKLFRTQLCYFKDIDFSEKIIYLKGFKKDDKTIQRELTDFSLR